MIRLSRLTDYAIVIVAELARDRGVVRAASDVAGTTHIPEPTVAKVLKILARANILESTRGMNGGYVMPRDLGQISVGEIIQAMNGPLSLTACVDEQDIDCTVADHCLLKGRWGPLNNAIQEAFARVTLADMMGAHADRCPDCPVTSLREAQHG